MEKDELEYDYKSDWAKALDNAAGRIGGSAILFGFCGLCVGFLVLLLQKIGPVDPWTSKYFFVGVVVLLYVATALGCAGFGILIMLTAKTALIESLKMKYRLVEGSFSLRILKFFMSIFVTILGSTAGILIFQALSPILGIE